MYLSPFNIFKCCFYSIKLLFTLNLFCLCISKSVVLNFNLSKNKVGLLLYGIEMLDYFSKFICNFGFSFDKSRYLYGFLSTLFYSKSIFLSILIVDGSYLLNSVINLSMNSEMRKLINEFTDSLISIGTLSIIYNSEMLFFILFYF